MLASSTLASERHLEGGVTQLGLIAGVDVARPDHSASGREPLDRYYTPHTVARRLVRFLPPLTNRPRILEPSVGGGAWVGAVRERWSGARVHGHDIDPQAAGLRKCDSSTIGDFLELRLAIFDAVVGNPPYKHAEEHVRHALTCAPVVGFLLRLAFLEGQARSALWADHPCSKVVVLSRRPSFTGTGTDACAYGFFVWDQRHAGPTELEVLGA